MAPVGWALPGAPAIGWCRRSAHSQSEAVRHLRGCFASTLSWACLLHSCGTALLNSYAQMVHQSTKLRVAFFQTLRLEMEEGLGDLLEANPEQLSAFFERFIGECVIERLSQDGGSLLEQSGVSAAAAFAHIATLRAYVTVQVRQRLSGSDSRFLPGQIDAGLFEKIVSEALQEAITAVGEWGEQG